MVTIYEFDGIFISIICKQNFPLRLATLQINHFLNVQQMKITKGIKNISNIEKSNEKTNRFQ